MSETSTKTRALAAWPDDKGTVSGRFSSSNPNLQQVPSKGEGTELIRQIFVPEDGEEWYSIEYSYEDFISDLQEDYRERDLDED